MRGIAVWACVVIGSILTLTSVLNLWIERQVLTTSGWSDTSDRILADQNVRAAAADALVRQVEQNVNIEQLIAKRFPRAAAVTPLAQVQVQGLVRSAAEDALASPAAAKAWHTANELTHSRAVAILRGKDLANGAVATENGKLVLDLSPVLQTLKSRLGIERQSANPNAGKIELFSESGLKNAQLAVTVVDALSVWLAFVAFGFFIAAVAIARPLKRRGVVLGIGWTLFAIGLVVLVARRVAIHALAPKIAQTPTGEKAVVDMAGTSPRRSCTTSRCSSSSSASPRCSGRGSRASRARHGGCGARWRRPRGQSGRCSSRRDRVVLLIMLWAPTGAVQRVSGALVLLAIILAGTEALRRQSVRDFPDAETAPLSMPGSRRAPQMDDHLANLERLGALRDKGTLTDEEFTRSKEQVLVGAGVAHSAPSAPEAPPPTAAVPSQ